MKACFRLLTVAAILLPLVVGSISVSALPVQQASPAWTYVGENDVSPFAGTKSHNCVPLFCDLIWDAPAGVNVYTRWEVLFSVEGVDVNDDVELCITGDFPYNLETVPIGEDRQPMYFFDVLVDWGSIVIEPIGVWYCWTNEYAGLVGAELLQMIVSYPVNSEGAHVCSGSLDCTGQAHSYDWRICWRSINDELLFSPCGDTSSPTETPTPTSAPTSTPGPGGDNCVPWDAPINPTALPSLTPTSFGATAAPTTTPTGSETPTPTATPFGFIPPPTTWTFANDFQGWSCYGMCGYSSDFGRGAGGSVFLGAETGFANGGDSGNLTLPGMVGSDWVMSGHVYIDDVGGLTPSDVRLTLHSQVYADWPGLGVVWLGNPEGRSVEYTVVFDRGAWIRFYVWPGLNSLDATAFRFLIGRPVGDDVYTWDDPFFVYLDDLHWLTVDDPTIPHCSSPTPIPPMITPVPIGPPPCDENICFDPEPLPLLIECIGLIEIDLEEWIGITTPGFGVCFDAFSIEEARIGSFDFIPILNVGLFGAMLIGLIQFVSKWRS